jgi:hypothetical protein
MTDLNEAYNLLLNESTCVTKRICPNKNPVGYLESCKTPVSSYSVPINNYGCVYEGPTNPHQQ